MAKTSKAIEAITSLNAIRIDSSSVRLYGLCSIKSLTQKGRGCKSLRRAILTAGRLNWTGA
jgi:hypothetical protein